MVSIYGLNKEVGNVSYYDSSGQNEYGFSKPYSEQTAQVIDKEVKTMIEAQYDRAKDILREHRDQLDVLAQKLIEKEVIFREDLEEIFGPRKFVNELDQIEEKQEEAIEAGSEQVVQPESGNDI